MEESSNNRKQQASPTLAGAAAAAASSAAPSAAAAGSAAPYHPALLTLPPQEMQLLRNMLSCLSDEQFHYFELEVAFERQRRMLQAQGIQAQQKAARAFRTTKRRQAMEAAAAGGRARSEKRARTDSDARANDAAAGSNPSPPSQQLQQQQQSLPVAPATLQRKDPPPPAQTATATATAAASVPFASQHNAVATAAAAAPLPLLPPPPEMILPPMMIQALQHMQQMHLWQQRDQQKQHQRQQQNQSMSKQVIEGNWQTRYRELLEFKEKHGHINVPSNEKRLYKWITTQRKAWKDYISSDGKGNITLAQIQKLTQLGMGSLENGPFKRQGMAAQAAKRWEEHFQELVQFKREHGHCNVSRSKHKDTHAQLANWVMAQRIGFQNRQAKLAENAGQSPKRKVTSKNSLSDERIQKLASIGFKFQDTLDFGERFQQLVEYKTKYGDTRVPVAFKEYSNLGRWVTSIKCQYYNDKLSADRIAKLNAIDFDWSLRSGPNRNDL